MGNRDLHVHLAIWAVALAFLTRLAAAETPSFDQGVDAAAVIEQAKLEVRSGHRRGAPGLGYGRPVSTGWETDCRVISFRPQDALVVDNILLESVRYEEVCRRGPDGRRRCRRERTGSERRRVRFEISGRGAMLPWEKDIFRVCLDGYHLWARTIEASYAYEMRAGWENKVVAVAGGKVPTEPDPDGLYPGGFQLDLEKENFELFLKDRWAQHYTGDEVVLRLELKEHVPLWIDQTVIKKSIALPAADMYTIRFADFAAEFARELQPGRQYYVKWGFQRMGHVSRPTWQGDWKTARVKHARKPAQESGALSSGFFRR